MQGKKYNRKHKNPYKTDWTETKTGKRGKKSNELVLLKINML